MGANRFPGQGGAKRDVGASGEHGTAAGEPICPTEGRAPLPRGGVATLCR